MNRNATSPAPRWSLDGRGRPRAWLPAGLALTLALTPGCSEQQFSLDAAVKKLFEPRRTPQQYMLIAVSDADSDVRREAVAKVAASKQARLDWAVQGFAAIALLENDPHARSVAIRGLVQSDDPRAAEVCLKLLNHEDHPASEVRPPDDVVRAEAAMALATLLASDRVPADSRETARETLLRLLAVDDDRHARIAAARGLGFFQEAASLEALIQGLRDSDFAVVHECEGSLVRLTGHTHHCNALDWEAWYEAHKSDAFANAGQIPESRRPPYDNRFEKFVYDSGQVLEWLWPGKKE
ncbi:MAG: HEAT repeat domain-containing protein [Phycisphaerae bacterium]